MPPRIGDWIAIVGNLHEFAPCPIPLLGLPELRSSDLKVYLFVVWRAGEKGEAKWSQASIAKAVNLKVDTVSRALKRLSNMGLLKVIPGAGRTPTRFYPLLHEALLGEVKSNHPPQGQKTSPGQKSESRGLSPGQKSDSAPGTVIHLSPGQKSNHKRTLQKEQKKEIGAADNLTNDEQEWLEKSVALAVFNENLPDDEAKKRRVVLAGRVGAGEPVDLVLGPVKREFKDVISRIQNLRSKIYQRDCLRHFREGKLTQESLEMFENTFNQGDADAYA